MAGRHETLGAHISTSVGLDSRLYQSTFNANWICLEIVAVLVMTPADELTLLPWNTTALGSEKFA